MIILGVVLLVVGFLLGISILWTIGLILVALGVIFLIVASVRGPIGGRKHFY